MSLTLDIPAAAPIQHRPIYTDNVILHMLAWVRDGHRCALVTLVGVDGAAPRSEGAQMAVSETGEWAGYISGGCLEQAIALEAVEAIRTGKHRLIRYGKGSPYFDIKLPCGSGLDIFIQPSPARELLEAMGERLAQRRLFALEIDLEKGTSRLESIGLISSGISSGQNGGLFRRVYTPAIKCLVIGASPIAASLAELATVTGFEVDFYTPDNETNFVQSGAVAVYPLIPPFAFATDPWTVAIVAFHDHDRELPVFAELLRSDCFFITAIGSRKAHALRVSTLEDAGFCGSEIARIKSPAGLIPGLKSAPQVALSILAEVIAVARERNFLVS